MQAVQRYLLRRENNLLSLRYAMTALKLHSASGRHPNVSFRDGQFLSLPPNPSSHSIELENKELYLKYVEEVLTAKEQELVQLEEHLTLRRTRLDQQEAHLRLITPLSQAQQAELLTRKAALLREAAGRLGGRGGRELEELESSLAALERSWQREHEALAAQAMRTMEEVAAERAELEARRSKLGQLESYEKYLGELQAALEQKECLVILRERELHSLALADSVSPSLSLKQQFNTYQEDSTPQHDQSMRKRARIFEPRTASHPELPQHKDSSKIMQENSTNDFTRQKLSKASEPEPHYPTSAATPTPSAATTAAMATQTAPDGSLPSLCARLRAEQSTVKFLRLWVKFSERANRGGAAHQKTMSLYRWRLNALFCEEARRKVESALCWPRRIPLPADPKQLSLRRRKYHEAFFEHERRAFHREKTLVRLRCVLRNRNRRERTAVLLVFHRYRHHAKLSALMALFQGAPPTLREPALQERTNTPAPSETRTKTTLRNDSRVLVSTSSTTEQKIHSEASRGKLKQTPSTSTVSKSRVGVAGREQTGIDIPRLKEYIKTQEETEAKLATECARTEAVFRTMSVLGGAVGRLRTRFLVNAVRLGETGKLNALEKAMGGCEFKWELFMAKARLALTNNANKIAHLEQLVGFIDK